MELQGTYPPAETNMRAPTLGLYYALSLMPLTPMSAESDLPGWPRKVWALLGAVVELSDEHELGTILQRIVEGVATVADARYSALGIYDQTGKIESLIHHGMADSTVIGIGALPCGEGLLGDLIVASGPVRLDDVSVDARSCGFPPNHPPMRTFLGVPITRGGRRYGNLYLTDKAAGVPFDDEDEAVVVAFAACAAGAIESARLVQAERDRAQAVTDLAAATERVAVKREMLGAILNAQETERARVSRDLHDDVGQALTSVLLSLRLVESSLHGDQPDVNDARRRTEDVRELVADALRRARQLAFDLRPTVLDDVGLLPALERLTQAMTARGDTVVALATDGLRGDRLPTEIETVVYRVVQEALTNVVRHAHASTASVTVMIVQGRVRALIEDDGVGFDADASTTQGHLGLVGMMERAELLDGTFELSSRRHVGTTVLLEVPLA